jgi:hypothetical protein
MSKATDLVSVSQGAGGDPLFIDTANDRVGVGTTGPLRTLDVVSSGSSQVAIRSTSTGDAILRLQNSTTGTGNDGIYLGRTGDGVNYLWTYENEPWVLATNNLERMRIDSSGRVTMPYQPIVVLGGSQTAYVGAGGAIPANLVLTGTSTGIAAYNTSTYRFTAPVAGYYEIGGQILWEVAGVNEAVVAVNGSVRNKHYSQTDRTIVLSSIVYLAAADYVEVRTVQAVYLSSYSNAYSWISYNLLG